MLPLRKGRYLARFARTTADLKSAHALRHRAFNEAQGVAGPMNGNDQDRFDARFRHVLVEKGETGQVVCSFRLLVVADGRDIGHSYSDRFYGLTALRDYPDPMIELGRFCIDPESNDPDIIRIAWAAITSVVDMSGAQMLFGCSSFHGTEVSTHQDAFQLLYANHQAPKCWSPDVKAPNVFMFPKNSKAPVDTRHTMLKLPPLLRSYLIMNGWVSDHAVIDHELNTMHVFTGLEIKRIPQARARLLRALSA